MNCTDLDEELEWKIRNLAININWKTPKEERVKFISLLEKRKNSNLKQLLKNQLIYDKLAHKPDKREVGVIEDDIIALISYLQCAFPTIMTALSISGNNIDCGTISGVGLVTTITGTLMYFLNKFCYTNRIVSGKIDNIRKHHSIEKIYDSERRIKIEDYLLECLGD